MKNLTRRQKEVYDFIVEYKRLHQDIPPLYREISEHFGVAATTVSYIVYQLAAKGWLTREKGTHGGIYITQINTEK